MFINKKSTIGHPGVMAILLMVLVFVASTSGMAVVHAGSVQNQKIDPGGLFDLYKTNRNQGVANYITADFLMLGYSMIRAKPMVQSEVARAVPQLTTLISGLLKTTSNDIKDGPGQANRDFLAILSALIQGRKKPDHPHDNKRAGAELKLILSAKDLMASPLWGVKIDYSAFKPRGPYTATSERERYFRTFRYANSILFHILESRATGVTVPLADRMTEQALRLATMIARQKPLRKAHQTLDQLFSWSVGPDKDLQLDTLLKVGSAYKKKPISALRKIMLDQARKMGRQPEIISG